ncbi:hypothetical protein OE88DRAFT_1736693 [Heliocybe sulcata]|uniref:Zn(2)-C6 fungal-type domain-containing protein n=1 Tax=Heliocybe sulcata TaxID=5364 RepID=A0A5C3MXR0_9AGAM|nr:hypothetical protein OE88DRAFT_1736693 [Heliocybe sulcata]
MSEASLQDDPMASSSKRRSLRACDLCRRAKSRCERPLENAPCTACAAAGVECVFSGPSFKRGPPKGYIQALEQRWYRSESVIAVLLSSPNPAAQAVMAAMQQDPLAREVLHSVNVGPLGLAGRSALSEKTTMDELLQYFADSQPPPEVPGSGRRPGKQPRASREEVSSQTTAMSFQELRLWQDRLSSYLGTQPDSAPPALSSMPPAQGFSGQPAVFQPPLDLSQLYPMDPSSLEDDGSEGDLSEAVNAFGHLSVDENHQYRYHGSTSGFNLISGEDRNDQRNERGVWKLPMSRVWPAALEGKLNYPEEQDIIVEMPTREYQEHLINVYFTYIHPWFPIVHKRRFLEQFRSNPNLPENPSSVTSTQTVSKALLLTMLATAERYYGTQGSPPPAGVMSEAGCDIAGAGREVIMRTIHHSHPSICQSLLLLGIREFAIGSTEQGWLYTGMAIRMAYDLGLNREPDNWKFDDWEMFDDDDKATRRAIWWACLMVDRHMSAFLGRPVSIQAEDYDVALPDAAGADEAELWQPIQGDPFPGSFVPVRASVMECFNCAASLSTIMGEIVKELYPVRRRTTAEVGTFQTLDNRLQQLYNGLSIGLRYGSPSALRAAPPHIMSLHVQYWYAVLLLHRAFLPAIVRPEAALHAPVMNQERLKHIERCETAAGKISEIVDVYREAGGLQFSPPFLPSYVLGAGVSHILLLSLRPLHDVASRRLFQCLSALQAMKVCWPGAELAYVLLDGVKLRFLHEAPLTSSPNQPSSFTTMLGPSQGPSASQNVADPFAVGYASDPLQMYTMAQMLGIETPGLDTGPLGYRADQGQYGYGASTSQEPASLPGAAGPFPRPEAYFGPPGGGMEPYLEAESQFEPEAETPATEWRRFGGDNEGDMSG